MINVNSCQHFKFTVSTEFVPPVTPVGRGTWVDWMTCAARIPCLRSVADTEYVFPPGGPGEVDTL